MNPDSSFMRQALAQAMEAQAAGEVPVGAVVVKDGQVIGVGRNAPIGSHDPSAHAEVVAMRAAAQALGNYRLDGCELYVTLEPCPMCAGAMLHARLQRVVYGAQDPKTGAAGSVLDLFAHPQINHHTQIAGGVLADECAAVLQTFFSGRRQARALHAQPLREDALRTPAAAFASLDDAFSARYFSNTEVLLGWRMHYLDEGPADASTVLLCLHGLPGWSYHYRQLIPALAARNIRVVVPDLIGFGKSDKPKKEAAHTLALHLESLQSLLTHLQIPKVLVLGEGAGLHLAQLLQSRMPQSVLQVVRALPAASSAADNAPFPDKGYQAGVRAAPLLTAQLAQAVQTLPAVAAPLEIEIGAGHVDAAAEQLAGLFLRG